MDNRYPVIFRAAGQDGINHDLAQNDQACHRLQLSRRDCGDRLQMSASVHDPKGVRYNEADTIADFLDAMRAAGIRPLGCIADKLATGKPIRFRAAGDKPGRMNGWACLHLDSVPAGVFRHYRLGIRAVWRAGSDSRALSLAERRAIMAQARESKARRKAETQAKQEAAAGIARDLWCSARMPDAAHGYLTRKAIAPFGIRQNGSALLVPMVDPGFRLWNLQKIFPDGRKRFLTGGRTQGLFWLHGEPSAGPLVIGEGFATMVAIHRATRYGVVAALSASNLEAVTCAIRAMFPNRELIVAADDDSHLPKNLGLIAATKAAQQSGGILATPKLEPWLGDAGLDFADMPLEQIETRIAVARAASTAHA